MKNLGYKTIGVATIFYEVDYRGPDTLVSVVDVEGHTSRGKAKCNPIDKYSPTIGLEIALARALTKLGTKRTQVWIDRT